MKLNKYINETRSIGMSRSRAENFIENNCQQALKGTKIYRGLEDHSKDFYYINPKQHSERISPFADHNYYNMLLSSLPSWKKYPARNKSLICTTDFRNAKHRSSYNPFFVFPKDRSLIGVCPADDIWGSFQDAGLHSLNSFNNILDEFFFKNIYDQKHGKEFRKAIETIKDALGIKFPSIDDVDTNYQTFIKASQTIDELKVQDKLDLLRYGWLQDFAEWNGTFLNFIDDLLDPDKNGFDLVTIGSDIKKGREVWLDSESVLVSTDIDLNLS